MSWIHLYILRCCSDAERGVEEQEEEEEEEEEEEQIGRRRRQERSEAEEEQEDEEQDERPPKKRRVQIDVEMPVLPLPQSTDGKASGRVDVMWDIYIDLTPIYSSIWRVCRRMLTLK